MLAGSRSSRTVSLSVSIPVKYCVFTTCKMKKKKKKKRNVRTHRRVVCAVCAVSAVSVRCGSDLGLDLSKGDLHADLLFVRV